jgi:hypothetical protein
MRNTDVELVALAWLRQFPAALVTGMRRFTTARPF